jgi:DNA invertase Pin-like site-specific DNA recombinase
MDSVKKITSEHLSRKAALYLRQSTVRQVLENQESTKRQYALRQQAVALGWPDGMVYTIDDDLGLSGALPSARSGFKKLISEVSQENVGIVISIEASRLSRNSSDWTNLLEICRLTGTLIMDEDGIYDPSDFNDRMLLGLKGTMSEAELHFLQARMKGGLDNKARRGELKFRVPVGYVYDEFDQLVKDPDENIQNVIRRVFDTYALFHSCQRTLRELRSQNVLFPKKDHAGYNRRTLQWRGIAHWHILHMLHNPIYAGVYQFGRRKTRKTLNGCRTTLNGRENMIAYIEDHHEPYISMEQYRMNQQCLAEHCAAGRNPPDPERATAVREGCALLQGVAFCGKCGRRMSVRYDTYRARGATVSRPSYWCVEEKIQTGADACQRISGSAIDRAAGELLVEMVTPLAMASVIQVQRELADRGMEIEAMAQKDLRRCHKEMEQAQLRYLNVDPANALVAKRLEADWNDKIHVYEDRLREYEKTQASNSGSLDERTQERIMAIASDFRALWENPDVRNEERKRMLRFLVESVTITQFDGHIHLSVRFKTGSGKEMDIAKGKKSYETWRTPSEALRIIRDCLENMMPNADIARHLNEGGFKSGRNLEFSRVMVADIARRHKYKTPAQKLREEGYISQEEAIRMTGLNRKQLLNMRTAGSVANYRKVESSYYYLKTEIDACLAK